MNMSKYIFAYDNEANDYIWNDVTAFTSYLNSALESHYDFTSWDEVKENWDWISHDTANTVTLVDNVKEWVKKNLDLSLCPNTEIEAVFIDSDLDMTVELKSTDEDIKEFTDYLPGIWEWEFAGLKPQSDNSWLVDYTLHSYNVKNPISINAV